MDETLKTFSDEVAKKLKAKIESPEFASFIEKTKTAGEDRTFEVVMSTSDEDRQGDSLDQSGWDLKYFNLNPVVLWAHNYSGFPIGIVTDIKIEDDKAIATGKFAPEGINPEADLACKLYQQKILRTVSPGYIQNDDGTRELLEMSFCSVPAGRYALSMRQVASIGYSTPELVAKGFFHTTKGAVQYADHGDADPDTAWDGPAEVKACGDDLDKLKAICAWFDSENNDKKSAYKLPHHEASGLKAVLKGVEAAGAAISGARGGIDIPEGDLAAVKAHLAKHYKSFGKTPPWEKKAHGDPALGDPCELEDGTPGTLADDPHNPGRLVCVPTEDKSSKSNNKPMKDELEKNLKAEHDRHGEAVGKAIDRFTEKCMGSEKSEGVLDKAIEEYTKSMDGEQADHLEKCMKAIDDEYLTMGREENKPEKAHKKEIDEFKSEMTDEHLKHVKACDKAIDEFKSEPGYAEDEKKKAIDEFTKAMGDELDRHEKCHMDMVKAEADRMGEGEDDGKSEEEKAIAEVIAKGGRAISAKTKEKIEAVIKMIEDGHTEHGKAVEQVTAALKSIMDSGDGGEEPKPEKSGAAPEVKVEHLGSKSELETYLFTQRLVRQVKTASEGALRQINEKIREARSGS